MRAPSKLNAVAIKHLILRDQAAKCEGSANFAKWLGIHRERRWKCKEASGSVGDTGNGFHLGLCSVPSADVEGARVNH